MIYYVLPVSPHGKKLAVRCLHVVRNMYGHHWYVVCSVFKEKSERA